MIKFYFETYPELDDQSQHQHDAVCRGVWRHPLQTSALFFVNTPVLSLGGTQCHYTQISAYLMKTC